LRLRFDCEAASGDLMRFPMIRRDFLKTSGLIALGTGAPLFLGRTAAAAPDRPRLAPNRPSSSSSS